MLAGHLHNRFNTELLQNDAPPQRRHPGDPTLIVGQIDCIDIIANILSQGFEMASGRPLWRSNLAGNYNLAGGQPALEG
jgi:hypothetical protein